MRVGKFGPFLSAGEATADLPEDVAPDEVTLAYALERLQRKAAGPTVLGKDPGGLPILLMNGRFGPFVQRGEMVKPVVALTASGKPKKSKKPVVEEKPDRASLLPGMEASTLTLDVALQLLSLPRTVGTDPGTSEEIVAANGRYGPYVRRGKESRSVPPGTSVLAISLAEASKLFDQPARRAGARAAIEPLRVLGADPVSGGAVNMMKGRFGPYVTDGGAPDPPPVVFPCSWACGIRSPSVRSPTCSTHGWAPWSARCTTSPPTAPGVTSRPTRAGGRCGDVHLGRWPDGRSLPVHTTYTEWLKLGGAVSELLTCLPTRRPGNLFDLYNAHDDALIGRPPAGASPGEVRRHAWFGPRRTGQRDGAARGEPRHRRAPSRTGRSRHA